MIHPFDALIDPGLLVLGISRQQDAGLPAERMVVAAESIEEALARHPANVVDDDRGGTLVTGQRAEIGHAARIP